MKALFLALLLTGCTSTVLPQTVTAPAPSFDGTNQNSGIVLVNPDHTVIITQRAFDRYNALIEKYGKRLNITHGYGCTMLETLTEPVYSMTAEAWVDFAKMTEWKRQGRK